MPFKKELVERIDFQGSPDDDQLLMLRTRSYGPICIRATFDNYPSPTPLVVDEEFLPEALRRFKEREVGRLFAAMEQSTRDYYDGLDYDPYRIYCGRVAQVGQTVSFFVDRRDIEGEHTFDVSPDEILSIDPIHRSVIRAEMVRS